MLAADGAVPLSVDGLRGVQQGVERLIKKGLVTAGEGAIALKATDVTSAKGEALEVRLYPEEFCTMQNHQDCEVNQRGSDSSVEGDSEYGLDECVDGSAGVESDAIFSADDELKEEDVDGPAEEGAPDAVAAGITEEMGPAACLPEAKSRKQKRLTAPATPAQVMPLSGKDPATSSARSKRQKRAASSDQHGPKYDKTSEARHTKGHAPPQELCEDQNEEDMFAALFADEMEGKASMFHDNGDGREAGRDKVAPLSRAQKRQHDEMAEALFGDASRDGSGIDAAKRQQDGYRAPGSAAKASKQSRKDSAARAPSSGLASPEDASSALLVEGSATGAWTYEVVGKKLGIRKVPDAENSPSNGHLAPGEFFNVTETCLGKDGRTYLRLADGRGWAYDRSAKDINKVVARQIAVQPLGGQ